MEEKYIQEISKYRKKKHKRFHGKHVHDFKAVKCDIFFKVNQTLNDVIFVYERCMICKKENIIYNQIVYL